MTPPSRHRLAALGLITVVGGATGCGSHSPSPRLDQDTPSTIGVSPSNRVATTIRSSVMQRSFVHLPVPSADLTGLIRVRGDTIAALVVGGAFAGEVYPAISTDDGGTWQIDGPKFGVAGAAACGRACGIVRHLDVSGDGSQVAWGPGGSFVATLPAGTTRWRWAQFDGDIRAVRVAGHHLAASLEEPEQSFVSTNDGLSWRRT